MSNRFVFIMAACIVIFGGIFWFNKHKTATKNSGSSAIGQTSNHLYGDGKKNVTLIEYGDLQCPACGAYFPIVKQLKETYKSDITFQYRNFPLVQIHQNAMAAHRAVEAASNQNKFWEMHDLLYTNQKEWVNLSDPTPAFESYASSLGLDIAKFKTDVVSDQVNSTINADIAAGQALGANSTPTFILQGKKIDENPRDYDSFSKLISDAITAAAHK